jgi:hypothetical protein
VNCEKYIGQHQNKRENVISACKLRTQSGVFDLNSPNVFLEIGEEERKREEIRREIRRIRRGGKERR